MLRTYKTTEPSTPPTGKVWWWYDDADEVWKYKLDDATVHDLNGVAGATGADGEGVPTGGTAGQVLTKDSGTDFDTSWQDASGGGAYVPQGSIGSPLAMSAGTDITPTADTRQFWFVKSSGGAVTITANPQIIAGASVGQEIILIGTDDTDYPVLNSANGLFLNGNCSLTNKATVSLIWDGAVWVETSRNDI